MYLTGCILISTLKLHKCPVEGSVSNHCLATSLSQASFGHKAMLIAIQSSHWPAISTSALGSPFRSEIIISART